MCPASTLGPPPETCSTSGFSSKTKKCTQHFHTHDCKVCKIMLKTKSWTLIYLPDGLASTKLYWLYLLPRITSLRTPWESAVPNHLVVPVWHVAKLCTDLILNKRSEIRQDTGTVEWRTQLWCVFACYCHHIFLSIQTVLGHRWEWQCRFTRTVDKWVWFHTQVSFHHDWLIQYLHYCSSTNYLSVSLT